MSLTMRRYPPALRAGRKLIDLGRTIVDAAYLLTGRRPPWVLFDPMGLRDKGAIDRRQGAWFHWGVDETCRFAASVGWEVVNPDLGLCVRDPIILLRRPA
jgi:hypothetical protein